jgi:Neuraminidase (sialidase)
MTYQGSFLTVMQSKESLRWMTYVGLLLCILTANFTLVAGVHAAQYVRVEGKEVCLVTGQGFFPVAYRMQNGEIGVVIRGGAMHLGRAGRLDFVKSADEGLTWSKSVVVLDTGLDDRNPAFGQAQDGTLVVSAFRYDKYTPDGRHDACSKNPSDVLLVYSRDNGKTWSAPRRFPMRNFAWLSPYGRILTLDDGAMVLHCYGNAIPLPGDKDIVEDEERNASYLFRSEDGGQTWSEPVRIALDYNETSVIPLDSKHWVAALRSNVKGQFSAVSHSFDGGKTWTEPVQVTLTSEHPPDLLRLSDGRILMVFGERNEPYGVHALLSSDGGKTWDKEHEFVLVDHATNSDCGYPSSVLLRDGRVLTVYYAVGSTKHPDWGVHAGGLIFTPPRF